MQRLPLLEVTVDLALQVVSLRGRAAAISAWNAVRGRNDERTFIGNRWIRNGRLGEGEGDTARRETDDEKGGRKRAPARCERVRIHGPECARRRGQHVSGPRRILIPEAVLHVA